MAEGAGHHGAALGGLGRLEVICGPMFSGKTTELLRRLRVAREGGSLVMAVCPARDTRSGRALRTHTGEAMDAAAIGDGAGLLAAAGESGVVGIDEAHFFGAGLVPGVVALVAAGRRVIVAGVERDHRGRAFEPFPALLCEADEVVKLSGPCAVCGRAAVHSQRMRGGEGAIEVGGAGMYEARCRGCFEGAKGGVVGGR